MLCDGRRGGPAGGVLKNLGRACVAHSLLIVARHEMVNTRPRPFNFIHMPEVITEAAIKAKLELQRRQEEQDHNVIHSYHELHGWTVTGLERWKKGVVRYYAFRMAHGRAEQKVGYAKDEVFEPVQLPP